MVVDIGSGNVPIFGANILVDRYFIWILKDIQKVARPFEMLSKDIANSE